MTGDATKPRISQLSPHAARVKSAYDEEYRAIVDAGLLLQVDDAVLPQWIGAATVSHLDRAEISRFADLRIEALNHALSGIPADRVRFHVCWGSWNGPHTSDAPLRDIIEYVLKVNADAYHQHEWQIWENVIAGSDCGFC